MAEETTMAGTAAVQAAALIVVEEMVVEVVDVEEGGLNGGEGAVMLFDKLDTTAGATVSSLPLLTSLAVAEEGIPEVGAVVSLGGELEVKTEKVVVPRVEVVILVRGGEDA